MDLRDGRHERPTSFLGLGDINGDTKRAAKGATRGATGSHCGRAPEKPQKSIHRPTPLLLQVTLPNTPAKIDAPALSAVQPNKPLPSILRGDSRLAGYQGRLHRSLEHVDEWLTPPDQIDAGHHEPHRLPGALEVRRPAEASPTRLAPAQRSGAAGKPDGELPARTPKTACCTTAWRPTRRVPARDAPWDDDSYRLKSSEIVFAPEGKQERQEGIGRCSPD